VSAASTAIAAVAKGLFTTSTVAATGATAGQTVAQEGLNVAMRANPIGIVITALAALAAGLVIAWQTSETFRNIVKGAFDAAKTAAEAVASAVQTVIGWISRLATSSTVATLGTVLAAPFKFAIDAVRAISGAVSTIIDWVKDLWGSKPLAALGAVLAAPFDAAIKSIRAVAGAVGKVIAAVRRAVSALTGLFNHPGVNIPLAESIFGAGNPIIPRAHGGIVTRPEIALIGEAGPEAIIPLSGRHGGLPTGTGGVGTTNHFHFHGAVGSREEVIEWVREGLIRGGRRMPGILGGLA
jgi:hypothetical protein